MDNKNVAHLLGVPFTGLGLYGGFRGNRWLKNRITIFKQFVVPSLLNQTSQDYILWMEWRHEERNNPQVKELQEYLNEVGITNVFTFSGVHFYDDKYPPEEARLRMVQAIHGSMGDLLNVMGDADTILLTIQPSDDCYHEDLVAGMRSLFEQLNDMLL